ncbi:MAG: 6-phosphogluconolactonase [Chloroflexi bacterium]|nr:MAG: 6-phosphogluconolactonase [Chloroflexota bacterium]
MRVLADAQAVAQAAAGEIAKALRGGARTLVLAGGTTPRRAYELLAGMDVKWGRVTVLFGDERCVAPEDPESNYRMARESLLDRVAPATVHRMPAELGPEEGARLYSSVVAGLEPLDLVILGLGPDGHCASLFPGHRALQAPGWAVAVRGAPKPPPDRVSLTLAALRGARRVIFLATGAEKAEALIPGAEWFVDREAAAA